MSWYKANASTFSANLPETANAKSFHMGSPSNERKNQPFLNLVCVSATFAPSASASDKKPTVYIDPPIHKQFQIYSPALSHRETTQAHGLPGLRVPDICIAWKAKKPAGKKPFLPLYCPSSTDLQCTRSQGNIAEKIHIGAWELKLLSKWKVENESLRMWAIWDSPLEGNQVIPSSETRRDMGWREWKWKPWP